LFFKKLPKNAGQTSLMAGFCLFFGKERARAFFLVFSVKIKRQARLKQKKLKNPLSCKGFYIELVAAAGIEL
jgi:hypothetical protein